MAREYLRYMNITPEFVKQHSDWIFLYGDNLLQKGEEGHRVFYKDFPNCVGIPTKNKPCNREDSYMSDNLFLKNTAIIRGVFATLSKNIKKGTKIDYIDGIGKEEDESRLYKFAPLTYNWLIGFIQGFIMGYENS